MMYQLLAMIDEPLVVGFLALYEHSNDSVQAQDALMAFYRKVGLIDGNYEITDEEARTTFGSIVEDQRLSNMEKDAYLSALDVAVQNHHPHGMAADILNEIQAAQYELIAEAVDLPNTDA
jgi:hypothetical protein